jgi:predicted lipoprotein
LRAQSDHSSCITPKNICQPLGGYGFELYDVAADDGKTNNLASRHPNLMAKGRQMIDLAHDASPHWKVPTAKMSKSK